MTSPRGWAASCRRARSRALVALAAAMLAAGCGREHHRLPPVCADATPMALERALASAPRAVALTDGTTLSRCVSEARDDAEIQEVGAVLTRTADDLAVRARRTSAAALSLGYLVGAIRRGAAQTNGIHLELVRHVEQATGIEGLPAARRAAFARGLRAGRRAG